MHNKMIASVVKTAGAFLYAGVGMGVSKSLNVNFLQTGVPTHKKNQGSNGGLTPEICKQAETYAVSAIFLSKGR